MFTYAIDQNDNVVCKTMYSVDEQDLIDKGYRVIKSETDMDIRRMKHRNGNFESEPEPANPKRDQESMIMKYLKRKAIQEINTTKPGTITDPDLLAM